MTTLKNKLNRMKTYNLDRHHAQVRKFPQIQELPGGGSVGNTVKRKMPDSITFLAKETKSKMNGKPIPDSVLQCPEVAAALARGDLVEIKSPARPAPAKPAPPSGGNKGGTGSEGGDSSGPKEGGSPEVASEPSVGDDSGSSESQPTKTAKKASSKKTGKR